MRKSLLWIVLLVAAVAGTALLASRKAPQWTTDSEAALAEFELGLAADQKLYAAEALAHYERAVELDPSFAAAKLFVSFKLEGQKGRERRDALIEELRAVDLSAVSPRERLLIERQLAFTDRDSERAHELLAAYVETNPKDPFALDLWCRQLWGSTDFDQAADCFQRLIEIDPNWVRAQNLLGYMAMAKGEWENAEEQFLLYRYMAPDQANPHDSLGELLMLTGRWDEARQEFEDALAVKPDFCESWAHLLRLELLRDDFAEVERVLHRAREIGPCGEELERDNTCRIAVWRAYAELDYDAVWEAYRSPLCDHKHEEMPVVAYEAALASGRREEAAALRRELDELIDQEHDEIGRAALLYLDGIRLKSEGLAAQAVEKFAAADELFAYRDSSLGLFKLRNRLELAGALEAAGETAEADRVFAELRSTNERLVERWLEEQAAASGSERTADGSGAPADSAAPGD